MAIARDSNVIASTGTSPTLTWSHTCTGSDLILIVFGHIDSAIKTITGATYNGDPMTQITTQTATLGTMYAFYLINPATGAHNVVLTASSDEVMMGGSISYTGAKQTGQPDAFNSTGSVSASSLSTNVTTVATNAWIAGWFINYNGGTFSGTGAFTILAQGTGSPSSGSWNGSGTLDTNGPIATPASTAVGASTTGANATGLIGVSIAPAAGVVTGVSMLSLTGVGT